MAKTVFFISTLRTVVTIILYTIISFVINCSRKDDPLIRVPGYIPRGIQSTQMPHIDTELMKSMISQIPAAAIVLVIEHISIGKEFGRINNYTINPNSEFLAIGVVNILGPMVGAYTATGPVSRTAINSKAGSRTPMLGVAASLVVVAALYTMTFAFFYVPISALAAALIHTVGDCMYNINYRQFNANSNVVVTPPSKLYEFWKIGPLDVLVFATGTVITISNSIERGVFAMITLSLAILLFRVFQAHGSFLGRVHIKTVVSTPDDGSPKVELKESISDEGRSVFLPPDRKDGSNPKTRLDIPYPGVFIYRLREGLNYANCATQLDDIVEVITSSTQRGKPLTFDKPGVS
jgi:solute carrier family 26 (sodium-independent sulfate anion transporter), member 11